MRYRIINDSGHYSYKEVVPIMVVNHIIDNDTVTIIESEQGVKNFACIIASENGDDIFKHGNSVEYKTAVNYLKSCENLEVKIYEP